MAVLNSEQDARLTNRTVFEKLGSSDPLMQKQAVDAVNDYTRTKMREESFFNEILPMVPISDDELDRTVESDKPSKVVDREPDSPAAISVPFATLPDELYIRGERYRVYFDRILSSRFSKDVAELRTFTMDIRQIFSDNAIRDMQAELDGKLLRAVETACVGADLTVPTSGVVQHQTISGGITRESIWDAMSIIPSTPSSLECKTVLMNNITINELAKFDRPEMGGDLAQNVMEDGWTRGNFMGRKILITIKKGLVQTNRWYLFADSRFIGKAYELEAPTMHIKREHFMLEFFGYMNVGATIGHTSSVGIADFV